MTKRSRWTQEQRDREQARKREHLAERRRAVDPSLPPYTPRPPRGPSAKPFIPEGHELGGVSTLTNEAGDTTAQWNKTRVAGADPTPLPEGFGAPSSISRLTRGDGSVVSEWQTYKPGEVDRARLMLDAWKLHVEEYRGIAPPVPTPAMTDDDTMTVYPLGDPHIGMLSWAPECGDHFDTKIAVRELTQCVRLMVASAPPSSQAIITNLGDFLHAQDDTQLTPGHKNKLDVDGRHSKVLRAGLNLLRGIVDAALERHDTVTIRNLPGNHDPQVAAVLAMWLAAVYEGAPRVIVADAYAPHQFDVFGATLIGWHHGDGTPINDLPALMAADMGEAWGRTTFHVWHTGHIHHLTRKEFPACVVESHRTMAARDGFHARRYRSGRSLSAITYHREFGEVARASVGIERVRAALEGKVT